VLDYSRISEGKKWRSKNEAYRKLHFG
jgi:hypothetical protein